MDEVSYENRWERADFYHAMRRSYRPTIWDFRAIIGSGLVGLGLYLFIGPVFILFISVAIGVSLNLVVRLVVIPARIWKSDLDRGEIRRITFNDYGRSVVSKSKTVDTPWSIYGDTRETANYYFLDMKQRPFTTAVRKASFKTPEDEALFRVIAGRNSKARFKPNFDLDH
jgi:hypothetical protein